MAVTKTIYRGDTPTFRFTITDDVAAAAFNLTNWTGQFYLKQRSPGTKTVDKALTITTPTTGVGEAKLSSSDTDTVGTYDAEVEIRRASDSSVLTVLQFVVEISQDFRTA